MNPLLTRTVPLAAWLAALLLDHSHAATTLPSWNGDPNTTRAGYLFGTDSLTPAPDVVVNPNGIPQAVVTTGLYSDGWQSPADPIELSGVDHDGAWDLGISGNVMISVAVAATPPAPGATYRVEFEVYAVGYRGITALPVLDALGLTAKDLMMTQTLVAEDPGFPGATWQARTWTGYFDGLTTNIVNFAVAAPSNNTAIVDTFEVFTRTTIVPEPSAAMLTGMAMLAWALRRKHAAGGAV